MCHPAKTDASKTSFWKYIIYNTSIINTTCFYYWQARKEILRVYSKKMGTYNTDIDEMAEKTDMYTGADLENLCREVWLTY